MAGLFMECEEEELEPWQKRIPEVTEDDDDDDEPIFVGEITCSKPPNNTLRIRKGLPPGLGLTKRPAASEMNNTTPKKSKLEPGTPVSSLSINSTGQDLNLKGSMTNSSAYVTNGVQILNACPKCKIHFHIMGPLKNHMKFCCPDLFNNYFPTTSKQETPTTPVKLAEAEKGKLVMLVNEFYYGKYEGDIQQEQKTNTTFKCCSCLKLLKNNIRCGKSLPSSSREYKTSALPILPQSD
ncbi:Zinc finger protein 280D [Acipenser ruthenus]|uniref:Zinc finger protein 280D n=1 Tax=Acipenser ruthenus TaxID=7906 RepID=A0A444UW22_ACIRT|nr:Zinc finger protein 280D [Acipenser ruthenus]